jgi:GNAT superfamily N-acetyltransferase
VRLRGIGAWHGILEANLLGELIEKYLFKERHVFSYTLAKASDDGGVLVSTPRQYLDRIGEVKAIGRLPRLCEARQHSDSWVLFVCEENNEVLGYSFLHIPSRTEWNDSLPTHPGEARASSSFVDPAKRGLGIRGRLMQAQRDYCLHNDKHMWAVIEKRNQSSNRSTSKNGGQLKTKNFLLKCLGHNVASIVLEPARVYLLLGSRRARR